MMLDTNFLKEIKNRFVKYNRERLQRTQSSLRVNQQDLLELLPLLFHVNHPSLPGFSGHETAFGIDAYFPEEKTITRAKKLWSNFEMPRQGGWQQDIQALFAMGSCGSVAFSNKSDLDIWLCYRPGLEEHRLEKLRLKCEAIETWAESLKLEVHFFLMDPDRFRKGECSELSSESSGSAQHRLLLDEFYRTSMWIAGKHPLWWYVSPDQEAEYDIIKDELVKNKTLIDHDFVDFGALPNIPAEEFFGAAVWQMSKGIDSPYKSVLKITLIEAYADSHGKLPPLCSSFKQAVYDNETDMDKIDPYVMLLTFLDNYLVGKHEDLRLEFIRHSFYIKLHLPLSVAVRTETWRHVLVKKLVDGWGWSESRITLLDNRKTWTISEVLDERKLLVEHLTKSYLFLSQFARQFTSNTLIDEKDLTLLGRKLYSIFERKPGKIEIINTGIAKTITEEKLTYMLAYDAEKNDRWLLYRGKVTGSEAKENRPLKVTRSLTELLAWCYFNQVVGPSTQILLHAPGVNLANKDLAKINEHLRYIHDDPGKLHPGGDDLKSNAVLCKSALLINVGKTPKAAINGKDKGIISGAIDIFKQGSLRDGIILRLEHVLVNSWKEVHVAIYEGVDGFFSWCNDLLNYYLYATQQFKDYKLDGPNIESFSSHFGKIIVARVREVLNELCEIYFGENYNRATRFIIEGGGRYYMYRLQKEKFTLDEYVSYADLLKELENVEGGRSPIVLDKAALTHTALGAMVRVSKLGVMQLFYQLGSTQAVIYILDESGALFYQKIVTSDIKNTLHHYYDFLRELICRQKYSDKSDEEKMRAFSENSDELLEFYVLKKEQSSYVAQRQDLMSMRAAPSKFELKVEGGIIKGKRVFTFHCGDRIISSTQYANKVFEKVARYVIDQREKHERYPIYLSSMTLDAALKKSEKSDFYTIDYLRYKRKIEHKLNQFL